MRGPLFLLGGLLFVACTCGQTRGGGGGCDIRIANDAGEYGGYGGYGGTSGGDSGGYSGCDVPNGQAEPDFDGGCEITACEYGFADCGGRWDDGCETQIRSNPYNCGACGNTCNIGCDNGACGGAVLVDSLPAQQVTALLPTDTGIIYATTGVPSQIGFHTSSGDVTYASSSTGLDVIALARSAGGVLALDRSSPALLAVAAIPDSGLAALLSISGAPEALVADDTYAYVAVTGPPAVDAGSYTEAGTLEASAGDASLDADAALDADADASFDADAAEAGSPPLEGSVERLPVGGGQAEPVIVEPGPVRALALAAGSLVVAYATPGRLYVVDTASLDATLIASGDFVPSRIAVDAGFVYVADESGARVISVALADGALRVVASAPLPVFDVRADAGQLWFTTADPGRLYAFHDPDATLVAGVLRARTPIALDATHVYWSSPGAGIVQLAR